MDSRRQLKNYRKVSKESRPKRFVGRPPLELPDPIPDTPENIARVVLNTKLKKRGEWRFEKRRARKSDKLGSLIIPLLVAHCSTWLLKYISPFGMM